MVLSWCCCLWQVQMFLHTWAWCVSCYGTHCPKQLYIVKFVRQKDLSSTTSTSRLGNERYHKVTKPSNMPSGGDLLQFDCKKEYVTMLWLVLPDVQGKQLTQMLDEDPALMERRSMVSKRLELYKSARDEIDSVAWLKWVISTAVWKKEKEKKKETCAVILSMPSSPILHLQEYHCHLDSCFSYGWETPDQGGLSPRWFLSMRFLPEVIHESLHRSPSLWLSILVFIQNPCGKDLRWHSLFEIEKRDGQ